ncbi:TraB/GumN family protein [Phenylobacterium sp.]|uniref:TraB/GumN family protein n=1 Tax=Phenylobacterium sp. TaxID=1871053 RepID=UPI002F3FCCCB
MRTATGAALILALSVALAGATRAAPPVAGDPEANVVEELVVVARRPAPAWWRVEKDGSTVWILGVLDTPLPKDVTWRRRELDEHLKGASALITGPRLHAGLDDIVGLFKLYGMLRTQHMEAALAPAQRARFVADREKLGKGPERYDHWRPMIAGQMLLRDSRPQALVDVGRQVRAEAVKRGTPVKAAGEYDLVPFAKAALSSLTPASEGECLGAALDDAETDEAVWRKAAVGWARGDVGAALLAPRRFDRCLLLMAGGPQLWRRSTDDLADAITGALGKPGHAVATVPLRRLVAKDGLIESLKARGLTVIGPDGPV